MTLLERKTKGRVLRQNQYLRDLTEVEDFALSMLKPIDLLDMNPTLLFMRPGTANYKVSEYWRVVLSSAPQGSHTGSWRSSRALVIDKKTDGVLGVLHLGDLQNRCAPFENYMKWGEDRENWVHQVICLSRCLPIFEFGHMTGGKLLTAMAMSRETMRYVEMKYNFSILWFLVRTLHGRSTQYNRLQHLHLDYLGEDGRGAGCYVAELRKKATRHMQEGVKLGKTQMLSLSDTIAYWEDRYLKNRMQNLDTGSLITPDPASYSLSALLADKKLS